MIKTIILGDGFVASHLPYSSVKDRLLPNAKQIGKILDLHKPNAIINCIGFCGVPNIDQCETEQLRTMISNTVIPTLLAQECLKRNIHLIQIGSGCIFSEGSPNIEDGIDIGWKEPDVANPVSLYSVSKYACDLAIGSMENVTTLRIRMPISVSHNARNFITKIKNYKKVIDEPNSVTFMDDLARCVDWCISNHKTGIYHVTNPGLLTAAQVMNEYAKYNDHTFEIISKEELNSITRAKRSNCVLNSDKLKYEGFIMTDSLDALESTMKEYCSKK